MALLKCHECQNMVSSEAKSCPQCGALVKTPISKIRLWMVRAIFLLIAVVILNDIFGNKVIPVSAPEPELVKNNEEAVVKADTCENNYKKCVDNEDLINSYDTAIIAAAKTRCKFAVEDHVKFGEPDWDWFIFERYNKGNDYVETGIINIGDNSVKIENMYGAKARTIVGCRFDLESKKVLDISIDGVPIVISKKDDTKLQSAETPATLENNINQKQYDTQSSEEEFNKNFRCPESFNTEEEKEKAFIDMTDWYFAHYEKDENPQLNAEKFAAYRLQVLKNHQCVETLNNINEKNDKYM